MNRIGFSNAAAIGAVIALAAASCSNSSGTSARSGANRGAAPAHIAPLAIHSPQSGTANVGFAGSTQALNEQVLGPAFTETTGYRYQGQGGGSVAIAQMISSGLLQSTVFESIGAAPIQLLEPKFTNYYVSIASSPIVIAYNPTGPFAKTMSKIARGKLPIGELFSTMATSGFRLGRTDPNVDPQGQAFLLMLQLAHTQLHVPLGQISAISGGSQSDSTQVFAETALDSVLQSGSLDAASAFLSQAVQLHLPYIRLPDSIDLGNPSDQKIYATAKLTLASSGKAVTGSTLLLDVTTITQQGEAPQDVAASDAFVAYLMSNAGKQALRVAGFTVYSPSLFGSKSGAPAIVRSALG